MKCKLCLKPNKLLKSHIIPEAFYEGIYDAKNRALPISSIDTKVQFIHKGDREELLCADCEKLFSKWETVLKRDLIDLGEKKSSFLNITQIHDAIIKVEGIRYNEFKSAVLSILWRLSVSSIKKYASYKLGVYEEKLRRRLITNDFFNEKEYPIIVTRYELANRYYRELILGFPPGKLNQTFTVQKFMIWGHCFSVLVNENKFPDLPLDIFLRQSGELYIMTRPFEELCGHKSVFERLGDTEVQRAFNRLK